MCSGRICKPSSDPVVSVGRRDPSATQLTFSTGEPPLFLGSSVFFAIRDALKAARHQYGVHAIPFRDCPIVSPKEHDEINSNNDESDASNDGLLRLESPATPERIRTSCVDPIIMRSRVLPRPGECSFFVKI